jgi:hypothetical protein
MRSKAVIVARVLLGLVFGLNGFLHWFPLELFLAWSYRTVFRSLLHARNDTAPAR